jgi:hypothetical protein
LKFAGFWIARGADLRFENRLEIRKIRAELSVRPGEFSESPHEPEITGDN